MGMFCFLVVEEADIGDDAVLDPFTLVVFLKSFTIGQKSRIAYFTKIYGYGSFHAETRCLVSVQSLLECRKGYRISMKDFSCLGPRNTVYTHGQHFPTLLGFPRKFGDVVLEEYVWTGMSTTILPGTVIGSRTIIAPGGVITGKVASGKFIRPNSYNYDAEPLESKMVRFSDEEICRYLGNVMNMAISDEFKEAPSDTDLFARSPERLPGSFHDREILFTPIRANVAPQNPKAVIIGYGLGNEIRNGRGYAWLDFEDFLASGEEDPEVCELVSRLNARFDLKFLFRRNSA